MRFLRRPAASKSELRYADNGGVRIRYEVRGRGPTLVLHHAFGGSTESWHAAGYVGALERHFRLVLIDGRGHGASDKPHEVASYSPEKRVGDIAAVFDDAGVERALYWGYSMGAWLGTAFALSAPGRIDRLVSGASAAAPAAAEDAGRRLEAFRSRDPARIARDANMPEKVAERFVEFNDLEALAAIQEASIGWKGHAVERLGIPVLYYVGDADELVDATRETAARTPGSQLHIIEGSDHFMAFMRSRVALDLVLPFLLSSPAPER